MALSNWDTLAVDDAGTSDGTFTSPEGVEVSVYKNWLYVADRQAWQPGRFTEPTVMQIEQGHVEYRDVDILAVRGPQNGVYVVVRSPYGYRPDHTMIGCGVYGFTDDDSWLGVTAASVQFLAALVASEQVGLADEHWARHLNWPALARHNQGDAFLAEQLGADTPTSPAGQAPAPLLMQVLSSPTPEP